MTTLKLTTSAGTNASLIGDAYSANDGVSWRNAIDRCDSDGNGRVFLDCDSTETADYISEQIEADDNIVAFEQLP